MEIPLSQGLVALIDDEDWPLVAPYRWCAHRHGSRDEPYAEAYVRGSRPQRYVRMHLLVLGATGGSVDHVNRNSLDNRKANLRLATRAQQSQNRRGWRTSSSQFKGVTWDRQHRRWSAQINADGIRVWLGRYDDEADAARAYDAAALRLHGPFAVTNRRVA